MKQNRETRNKSIPLISYKSEKKFKGKKIKSSEVDARIIKLLHTEKQKLTKDADPHFKTV